MFEKHKQKKLEKLRRMEANASFVQGDKEKANENEEQAYYEKQVRRKKSMRRAMLRSLAPGFAITVMLGLGIYYTTLPLGQFMAFGITLILLIASNILIYVYTNRIYIPPGIDFLVFGPEYIDDPTSRKIFGMWRVPTALTGNIHKDLDVPLKTYLTVPADSSKPYKERFTRMYYTFNDFNNMEAVGVQETMAYYVANFSWDEDTGEIKVAPPIIYSTDQYMLQEGVLDEVQVNYYHLNRAYTLLKTKMHVLIEKRVREIMGKTIHRITREKYMGINEDQDENINEIENEIEEEEEKLKPKGRGEQ